MKLPAFVAVFASAVVTVGTAQQPRPDAITSVDHYVGVTSTVPSIAGQVANIYVRERQKVGPVLDDPAWADIPWTPPDGKAPLVLVAMSSTFQDRTCCLQALRTMSISR